MTERATYAVRMVMTIAAAEEIAALALRCPPDVAERVQDQLWLRSVLLDQRRRTRIAERSQFDARADRLLELLDPPADESASLQRRDPRGQERHEEEPGRREQTTAHKGRENRARPAGADRVEGGSLRDRDHDDVDHQDPSPSTAPDDRALSNSTEGPGFDRSGEQEHGNDLRSQAVELSHAGDAIPAGGEIVTYYGGSGVEVVLEHALEVLAHDQQAHVGSDTLAAVNVDRQDVGRVLVLADANDRRHDPPLLVSREHQVARRPAVLTGDGCQVVQLAVRLCALLWRPSTLLGLVLLHGADPIRAGGFA